MNTRANYTPTRGRAGDPNDKVASQGEVTSLVMAEARRRGLRWFKPFHAAGMVGSFVQETGNFRRDVINLDLRGDDGTAYGLMQWRGGRYRNLIEYSRGKNLDPRDIRTQVAFAFEEASPSSKYSDFGSVKAFRQFQSARSERDAAIAFVHAERPAGYDGNPNNAHDVGRRISHAQSAIKDYGDSGGFVDRRDPRVRNDPDVRFEGQGSTRQEIEGGFRDPLTGERNSFDIFNPFPENDFNRSDSRSRNGTGFPNPEQIITPESFGLNDFVFNQDNNPFINSLGDDTSSLFGNFRG